MSDSYAENMSRDKAEAKRLDEQFELLTVNVGYILHPEIIAHLSSSARVADIGTGTGVFLRKLHDAFPDITLDGFDISTKLFPPSTALPANITLQPLDIKETVPKELEGQYDVVHIRMLAAGMLPREWELVVNNAAAFLKPGGWLQWLECDFSGVKHLRGCPGGSVETARMMGRLFRDALRERFEHGWNSLPMDMRAAGLYCINTDLISSDQVPETRKDMTANGMQAIFSWARLMTERGVVGALSLEKLESLETQAFEDISSGCYVRFDVYVSRGRK